LTINGKDRCMNTIEIIQEEYNKQARIKLEQEIRKKKIAVLEKCFSKEELKEAREFCTEQNIDYYTFLCMGCNKALVADAMAAGLISFKEAPHVI